MNGIWDCKIMWFVYVVCPQGIDPKILIFNNYKIYQVQNGFENQKLASFSMDFN